jgi:hypothetical protein
VGTRQPESGIPRIHPWGGFKDAGKTVRGAWLIASQWPHPSTAALSFSGAGLSDSLVEQVRSLAKFITLKDGAK